jgi:hypothetical protein
MKLSQLSAEPQLVEVTIDDKDIIKEYGEPLVFYTWDRQPMEVFTKLANVGSEQDTGNIIDIVKNLILDENGKQIISNKNMLPSKVLMKAIGKVTDILGK